MTNHRHDGTRNAVSGAITDRNKNFILVLFVKIKISSYDIFRLIKDPKIKILLYICDLRQYSALQPFCIIDGISDLLVFDLHQYLLFFNDQLLFFGNEEAVKN